MATLVPCLAKRWLIAWPMPEAPPVTTATLLMVVYFFLTGLAASVGWREGDVQVAQPAHDEGGIVVEMPLTRWAVVGFRDRNVACAIKETTQCDAPFGAGQWTARAGMCAPAESDVFAHVLTSQAALIGVLETALIPIGCARVEHHRGSRRNVHPAKRRGDPGHPEVTHRRAFQAQHFLDEIGNQTTIAAQAPLNVLVFSDDPKRGAQHARRGILARAEQERGGAHDRIEVGQRAVFICGRGQLGEDIVAG